jgi:hypothetical protein
MEDNSGIPPFLARLKMGLVELYFWAKIEEIKSKFSIVEASGLTFF